MGLLRAGLASSCTTAGPQMTAQLTIGDPSLPVVEKMYCMYILLKKKNVLHVLRIRMLMLLRLAMAPRN